MTFDDGERSVFDHAFPSLAEFGVPGTVFVSVATRRRAGKARAGTIWRHFRGAGWEVGSHSLTHRRLTQLETMPARRELRSSREAIENRLDRPCRSIAYPYGAADERVLAAAARAGYTAGCTTGGTLGADALGWPRVGVDGNDGDVLFRLKTSRLGRSLRGTPLRNPVDRAGRVIRRLGVG